MSGAAAVVGIVTNALRSGRRIIPSLSLSLAYSVNIWARNNVRKHVKSLTLCVS